MTTKYLKLREIPKSIVVSYDDDDDD